jgi:hypothetical protein
VVQELDKDVQRLLSEGIRPDTRWEPVLNFSVANDEPKLTVEQLFVRNTKAVAAAALGTEWSESLFEGLPLNRRILGKFGSAVELWLDCRIRDLPASHRTRIVVPGNGKSPFRCGDAVNAVVFCDTPDTINAAPCPVPACPNRHHFTSLQFGCSAARDGDSSYGIPLLFDGSGIFLVRVTRKPQSMLPHHKWLFEVEFGLIPLKLSYVPFRQLRGICMFRHYFEGHWPSDSVGRNCFGGFIFRGRDVFGFDLQL